MEVTTAAHLRVEGPRGQTLKACVAQAQRSKAWYELEKECEQYWK